MMAMTGWQLPAVLSQPVEMIAGLAVPGALIAFGMSLHGAPPHEALFRNHALVDGSLRESLGTFRGGGHSLIKALVRKIRANGGLVRTGCGAAAISCADGAVTGVRDENGELWETERCIYTGHPALLPGLMPPEAFRGVYRRRLEALPETTSCCMLFAEVEDAHGVHGGDHGLESRVCKFNSTPEIRKAATRRNRERFTLSGRSHHPGRTRSPGKQSAPGSRSRNAPGALCLPGLQHHAT